MHVDGVVAIGVEGGEAPFEFLVGVLALLTVADKGGELGEVEAAVLVGVGGVEVGGVVAIARLEHLLAEPRHVGRLGVVFLTHL